MNSGLDPALELLIPTHTDMKRRNVFGPAASYKR
jgi:hypothetical protein